MFREDITFVIGAGASYEFGLPIGSELAGKIKKSSQFSPGDFRRKAVVGDEFFAQTVHRLWSSPQDRLPVYDGLDAIHKGIHTAVSIDAFIHRNSEDPLIPQLGKMLIALEIAKAERASLMHESQRERVLPDKRIHPDYTWVGQFVRILFDGVTKAKDVGKGVRIVCFNYDRCIEYYLRNAIVAAFRVPLADAHKIVQDMNIIHPYGWLGELGKDGQDFGDGRIPFGPELDSSYKLEVIAENIRTYTEGFEKAGEVSAIQDAIAYCNVLVFLGFGFNNQNLDLLRVHYRQVFEPRRIYATGYGISNEVDDTMKRRIRNLYSDGADGVVNKSWDGSIYVGYGVTCGKLFDMHNMNFSSFTQRNVRLYDGIPRIELVSSQKR